jgi:histidinol dehydrogenase
VRILRLVEKACETYLSELDKRAFSESSSTDRKVRSILNDVRERGDEALLHYTRLYDKISLSSKKLEVKREEVREAYKKLPPKFLATLKKVAHRIRRFHERVGKSVIPSATIKDRREKGIRLEQRISPLERVGIYVPGGKASYPSTVLMAAIPAKVAGVQEIFMVTPPQEKGISPAVLVAADLVGVDRIFRIGGVQAIGALAYGTGSIPKVDKIVGPGNRYVACAKQIVFGTVDIDMVAGPSEIVIICDAKTPPSFVAADLISQAEHDEMALPVLITISEPFAHRVKEEVARQLSALRRKRIAQISLDKRGAILIVKGLDQAIDVANRIAPEHLELSVSDPSSVIKKVKHAGAVFLGPYTPEAIGDYLAGTNHILPTAGTARFSSPLGVEDFLKRTNVIGFTKRALGPFEEDVRRMTEWEGLEGHYRAVHERVKER